METQYNVAVVGATGAVGETMLSILEQRDFPVAQIFPLASARSAGKTIHFKDHDIEVLNLEDFDFSKVDFGLFSAGASVSKIYAPKAAAAGCWVIDNTSQFRYNDDIPLVVPEVNPGAIDLHNGIIANPNCSTIQLVVALKPIYDAVGIERINICTYQAVSGAGHSAMNELTEQTGAVLNKHPVSAKEIPTQIAFNAIPHIDVFQDNGYTKEEMKMVWETRKILQDESIQVNPTAVRIPVYYGHSEAVHLETKQPIDAKIARELLSNAPGIEVIDDIDALRYPTAAVDAAHHDAVYVGRIRNDISHPRGLNLWVVSDNLRKGAALNSVQIAETIIHNSMALDRVANA